MMSRIFIAILLSFYFVEPKQISFDNKLSSKTDNATVKELSNIEHLDNTLRTYRNFAKKCRICEFPESSDEFVCKETPCKSAEELAKHPVIRRIRAPEPCINNTKHENNCAICICDFSGEFLNCMLTKTVPLCLLYSN